MTPFKMSSCQSTVACIVDQYPPESTPNQSTPTICPPRIATALKIAAKSVIAIIPAQNRGEIILWIGFTAIISILESCSVAFIRPISAVNAEPALPANKSAATTGPSSLTRLRATRGPRLPSAPNFINVV